MAALSDIIKRVSAGNQAAKESLASGGTREQAREAGQKAAGAKAEVLQGAMQEAMRQLEKAQQPAQTTAPGMQRTASGDTEEAEESSMTEDREDRKAQREEQDILGQLYDLLGPQVAYADEGQAAGQDALAMLDYENTSVRTKTKADNKSGKAADESLIKSDDGSWRNSGPLYPWSTVVRDTQEEATTGANSKRFVSEALDQLANSGNEFIPSPNEAAADLLPQTLERISPLVNANQKWAQARENRFGGGIFGEDPLRKQPAHMTDENYEAYKENLAKRNGYNSFKDYEQSHAVLRDLSLDTQAKYLDTLAKEYPDLYFDAMSPVDIVGESNLSTGEGDNSIDKINDDGAYSAPTSQMAEFYEWSLSDAGKDFRKAHPEFYDTDLGYETVEDYLNGSGSGYGRLFGTQDRDVWATLLGLDGGPGIESWRRRYGSNGVDLAADDSLDQLMDYLFGANAVNVRNVSDSRLQTGNMSEDALANAQIWRALADMYGFGPSSLGLAQAGYDRYDWDPSDLAYYMTIANMQNGGLGDITLDEINAIKGAAGEEQLFGYLDDEEGGFNERGDNKRRYSLNQLANLNITPWTEGDAPVYDMYMIDALTQAYNESHPDKKIGTK